MRRTLQVGLFVLLAVAAVPWPPVSAAGAGSAAGKGEPAELLGVWKGTSTCTDLVAAPACHDEVVVYEFEHGDKAGVVRWKAYKIVKDEKLFMGEMDLAYDAAEACWKAEFSSPRGRTVWRLVVEKDHITGTGRLDPGGQTIRKIDVRRSA